MQDNKEQNKIRLQKFIANCGYCSRRKAEELILQGKVRLNGMIVEELGIKVDPKTDLIEINGSIIKMPNSNIYILLNKPIGYVTTVKDQFKRPTVMDLIKNVKEKVLPVGRLDMYTSGALILSNDGDFIYEITHPKHEITKTYQVTISGTVTDEDVEKLKNGVIIDDYVSGKANVRIMKIDKEKNISRIEITIHEGKNREVRKMCEAIGKGVKALHRSKIGGINVKNLKIGEWRYLNEGEVNLLKNHIKNKGD